MTTLTSPRTTRSPMLRYGPLLVTAAAVIWGLDGIFRGGLAEGISPATIVFLEHVILVAAVLPILPRAIRSARANLDARGWAVIMIVGGGASALATVLFTQALSRGDFITPLVLQKLQPFVAILGARLIVGERLHQRYWLYFAAAIGGAWLLTFSDPFAVHVRNATTALLAIGAAILWGMGTVFARYLSPRLRFEEITALRFAFGLPVAFALALGTRSALTLPLGDIIVVVYIALVSGLLALLLYYYGMKTTPASVATVAEMAFVATTILVGVFLAGTGLSTSQWAGAALLTGTVVLFGWRASKAVEDVGVEAPNLEEVPV